jgi:hypothetical protein
VAEAEAVPEAALAFTRLLTEHEASAPRGRIQFAKGQVFCRCGRVLSLMLADLCEGNGAYTEKTEAIRKLSDLLATSGPRVVCMRESEDSVLIFTEGASRPESPPAVESCSTESGGRRSTSA